MKTILCHDYLGAMLPDSALNCFMYIHKNPLKITNEELTKWKFSSYLDYAGLRNGTLCNKELACQILGLGKEEFVNLFL